MKEKQKRLLVSLQQSGRLMDELPGILLEFIKEFSIIHETLKGCQEENRVLRRQLYHLNEDFNNHKFVAHGIPPRVSGIPPTFTKEETPKETTETAGLIQSIFEAIHNGERIPIIDGVDDESVVCVDDWAQHDPKPIVTEAENKAQDDVVPTGPQETINIEMSTVYRSPAEDGVKRTDKVYISADEDDVRRIKVFNKVYHTALNHLSEDSKKTLTTKPDDVTYIRRAFLLALADMDIVDYKDIMKWVQEKIQHHPV